jgi:hypothetical protein
MSKKTTIMQSTRSGFALPTAILLLLCMTAGVTAALARVRGETVIVDNGRAQTAAFAVAQGGLELFMARGRATPTDTTLTMPGGTARIRLTAMQTIADTTLYLIRSDGVVAGGVGRPEGRRTVGQYAYHVRARLKATATWTSFGGLTKEGLAGYINGFDACAIDTIAAVAVPTGTYEYNGGMLGNRLYGPEGPTFGAPRVDDMGSTAEMATHLNIDWAAMTNPVSPAALTDIIVCYPGTTGYNPQWGPCGKWPAKETFADQEYWPSILINGSAMLPTSGQGTLLVTGNLTLLGGQSWDGILMVGNVLTDNGTGRVGGVVFSGLNALKGEPVDRSFANGTKNYQYNSCSVAKAAARQSRFHPVPNAWVDNWATW